MIADALPAISGPSILCLQAGNVNSGAFDPAPAIIPAAHAAGAWVHVDGAFGLWASAAPRLAHLAAGLGEADSWATDAHKWLNVPYDSGVAFVRNAKDLEGAMSVQGAAYLPTTDEREPARYTPEFSRRARGIEIWAALRSLGRTGLADLIQSSSADTLRALRARVERPVYEILNDVVLNQVRWVIFETTPRPEASNRRGTRRETPAGVAEPSMARQSMRDANQRFLVGHDSGRCGAEPGGDNQRGQVREG